MEKPTSRLLLIGGGLSAFGTWIDFIAILTLSAYQYRVSSVEMALVSAVMLLPGILLSPTIGRACDQKDPRRLLLLSIVMRVACTAGILLFHDFMVFLVLIALRSVFANVAPPAINVMAIRSIDKASLPQFYSVLNVLSSAAKIVAPALGTISSSLSSEAFALVLSASFSSASLIAFALIRPEQVAIPNQGTSAAKTPASATKKFSAMLPLLWLAGAYAFFAFMVNNLVPVVLERSGFDKSLLGVLISCSGAGNFLSGLWLAKHSGVGGKAAMSGRTVETIVPALLQAVGFAVVAVLLWLRLPNNVFVLPFVFFIIGTFSARYAIALNVHLSTHYAGAIGSASGALQATQNVMILVAPMVGALILDAAGGPGLFGAAAVSAFLLYGALIALQTLGVMPFRHSNA